MALRFVIFLALALTACEKSENRSAFGPRGTALPPPAAAGAGAAAASSAAAMPSFSTRACSCRRR